MSTSTHNRESRDPRAAGLHDCAQPGTGSGWLVGASRVCWSSWRGRKHRVSAPGTVFSPGGMRHFYEAPQGGASASTLCRKADRMTRTWTRFLIVVVLFGG